MRKGLQQTAASQAQRQVRKAGTSFPQFLGRSKEKIRNPQISKTSGGVPHRAAGPSVGFPEIHCVSPRLGCVNLSFLQQSPFPTRPSKKPNSLTLWDQGAIFVPTAATPHPLPANPASTQWLQLPLGSWGAHTASSAHPKS